MVRIEQLIKHTVFIKAGVLAAMVVRNFLVKGFIKKGLNGRLTEHVNKFIKNIHLYIGVFTYITYIVS